MKRPPRSVVIIRSEPALGGAGTPCTGESFWDWSPAPTRTPSALALGLAAGPCRFG
jgi:hypothetical protein